MSDPRTVVVGLDGADFRFLDRFAAEMPTVTALRERGVEAPLESTHPPSTASAWPSAYTGVSPAEHGVSGFFTYEGHDPSAARLVSRGDVGAPAVWDYLTARGVPSVVLNVPVTHPPEEMAGALVPGYFAPPGAEGHPEGVRDRLPDDYRIYPEGGADRGECAETPDVEAFLDLVDRRTRGALALLESVEWQFAFLQVQATDTVAHDLGDLDAVRRVYAAADDFLSAVLGAVPDGTTVLVCSDHGMGPTDGHRIYVNELLRDAGLLAGTGAAPTRQDFAAPGIRDLLGGAVARTARSLLARLGVAPGARVSGDRPAIEGVDWSGSSAFCRVGSEMGVRVNLAGREPEGVVDPGEYEPIRQRVIDTLRAATTPGGPAFAFVERYEERTGHPPEGDAPDVVFLPASENAASAKLTGFRIAAVDGFDHRRRGVFVGADGAFSDVDRAPREIALTDVAPIAMATLGLEVPERTTGSVPDPFPQASRRQYEGLGVDHGEGGDAGGVRDRLEDLGYL